MRLLTILLFFVTSATFTSGQKILLVDDSKDNFQNTAVLSNALTSIGREHDYFDAVDELSTPNLEGLLEYDIVIWHTSSDGANLQFWEGMDQENEILKQYLDAGKILWVIGNDFLFDRYATGESFSEGSFEYDYLGISSYDAQSYQDDGAIGMPKAVPSEMSPITGLNELSWQFATLWNADAVSLADGAAAIYNMGSSEAFPNYTFDGLTTAVLNQSNEYTVLSYFFDLSLAENSEMIASNLQIVLEYFDGLIVDVSASIIPDTQIRILPNPASDFIQIVSEIEEEIEVSIYSSQGRLIKVQNVAGKVTVDISDLEKGMYYVQFGSAKSSETQSFIKM